MDQITQNSIKETPRDDIETALDLLAEGAFEDIPAGFDSLGVRIKEIATANQKDGKDELIRLVSMSINLNEAVTSAAGMIRDTREVDKLSQTIASAAEEMVASVHEIARNSEGAAEEASNVRASADKGVNAAEKAVSTMQNIADAVSTATGQVQTLAAASEKIGEIVEQIDAIAKQTNLLALNATIEAARAGEAGKGFAVVASEVKNLSNQTSNATENIRERIDNLRQEMDGIVTSMEQGSKAVNDGLVVISNTGEEMQNMSNQVIGVTTKMEEIAVILGEQTEASNEVAKGITTIADMTSKNVTQIETIVDFLANTDEELINCLDALLTKQIPDMTIYRAKSDHIIWKKKLAEMMVGRVRLNPQELADHHQCRLGKWYDTIKDPKIRDNPAFTAMVTPHDAVHRHGIEAAHLYEDGDLEGALAEINRVAEYSKEVVRLLDDLIDD